MSITFKNLTPMLQTGDMQRSIDWYTDVLGFKCVGREENGWCRLERDSVALMFMENDHLGKPQATVTQYIYVDDAHALFEKTKNRVTPEWGPQVMPYGILEFAIKDPDGYLLSFGQVLKES